MPPSSHAGLHVRTVFLSDIHLGARECRADLVLEFLRSVHADELVLVGDIIDLWSMRRTPYWPAAHNDVLRTLMARARGGQRIVYVPGNHDETFREYCGSAFGSLEVRREYEHVTARGQRFLVVHGDEFDVHVECSRWLAATGTVAYDLALLLNRGYNWLRHAFGYPYWSLATFLKSRFGDAMRHIERYEQAATRHAQRRGYDGIICGHIHQPVQRELDGVQYCNTGDWVENCTALVEDLGGELRLLSIPDWLRDERPRVARLRAA
jgi:UDP-2,3-diacylglucosamine pyrophosphatase LpxH